MVMMVMVLLFGLLFWLMFVILVIVHAHRSPAITAEEFQRARYVAAVDSSSSWSFRSQPVRNSKLGTDELGPGLGGEGLRALDGSTDGAVDDELGKHTESAGDTEEDSVEVLLLEAVVLEEHTGVGVDVGEGVLGLAVLGEDAGGDLVDLGDELEHGVLGEVLEGELALADVAGVGLAEDGVAVTGNDTARLEGVPEVLGDVLVGKVGADGLLHLGEPVEDLLVGETVEGTGKTVQASGEREVGRGEGRADQVGGVGGDIATLVVSVDGQVETHELNEVLVLSEAELVGQVVGVVLVLLGGGDLAVLVDVAVDAGGNVGELADEVHGVLESVLPVLGLLHALGVGLSEVGLVLKRGDGERELGHGVEVVGAAVDELGDEGGELAAGSPLSGQVADLLLRGDLAGEEEPEKALRKRLVAAGSLGEKLLALGDGLATETDTLLGVEDGALPDERLDATGTTVDLVEGDLANDLVTVLLLEGLDLLDLLREAGSEGLLEGL